MDSFEGRVGCCSRATDIADVLSLTQHTRIPSNLRLLPRELEEHTLPYCEKVIAILDEKERTWHLPSWVRFCSRLSRTLEVDDQHRVGRDSQVCETRAAVNTGCGPVADMVSRVPARIFREPDQ